MKVYIEYVIFNNLMVNLMILYLTGFILKRRIQLYRLVLSSCIGTIYAVLLPYIGFKYDFGIKVILSFIMIVIAFSPISIKEYVKNIIVFYLLTFVFGGIIIGLQNIINFDVINSLLYPNSVGVGCLALMVILFLITCKYIIHVYLIKYKRDIFYYNVTISFKKKTVNCRGYLDSGNKLYYKGVKVVVVDDNILNSLSISNECCDCNLIEVKTINKETFVRAYKLDSIVISNSRYNKFYKNIYAIRSNRQFKDYQILLHCDM